MGLKITTPNRAKKFEQANWMRPYMVPKTNLRIAASTDFGKRLCKCMKNSAFEKACMSKRNRDQVVVVGYAQSLLQRTQNFKSFRIFGESMVAIKLAKNIDLLE